MTVRPVTGLSRIGLRTADGCFCPLMLESFRGVRQLVLTTTEATQQAADIELFLEEPGGGERYQHLGTVHLDDTAATGAHRPDLVLRVSLDTGRVLTAVVTGPAGRGELRVALQRYSLGDIGMSTTPDLARVREVSATGDLDGEPRSLPAPAAASWRAAGGRADDDTVISLPRFVHRCTSTMPVNAMPHDPERILWLAERADADDTDADGAEPPAGEVRAAFERREYGLVQRLLHDTRSDGTESGIPAELTDYWLDG